LILKTKTVDAGKDIALEVERLKAANVDGIVLDVRDDGGGSLSTVVDIAGLYRAPISTN
jgi:carboxyl-terminal processing protease